MHRTLALTRHPVVSKDIATSLLSSSSSSSLSLLLRPWTIPKSSSSKFTTTTSMTTTTTTCRNHQCWVPKQQQLQQSPPQKQSFFSTNNIAVVSSCHTTPFTTTTTSAASIRTISTSSSSSSSSAITSFTSILPSQGHPNWNHNNNKYNNTYKSEYSNQQHQHHNRYNLGVRWNHRYFSTTSTTPPPSNDDTTTNNNNVTTTTITESSSSPTTTPVDSNVTDDISMNSETATTSDTTDTTTVATDATTDTTPPTPEEVEAEKRKLLRLARQYGVNLDGSPHQNDDDDGEDDDDDSPPDHDDEEMYGAVGKNQKKKNDDDDDDNNNNSDTKHRSTNIGIPARPEDPVPIDGKTVRVMFCYSKYEIMEGTRFEDTVGQFYVPLTYDAIVKEASEFYQEEATSEYFTLEYYHQRRWHPLTENCYDILLHYHKEQILHHEDYQTLFFIRMPFMYDTSDYPEEDGQGIGGFNTLADAAMGNLQGDKLPNPPPTVQDKIIQILQLMKKKKFQIDPTSPSPYDPNADIMQYKILIPHSFLDGEDVALQDPNAVDEDEEEVQPISVSTRDYVLNVCKTDYDMRDILLLNINALNHIVKCLHYDIYWNFPLPKRQDIPIEDQEDDIAIGSPKTTKKDYDDEHDADFDHHHPTKGTDHLHNLHHHHHHHHNHQHTADCRH